MHLLFPMFVAAALGGLAAAPANSADRPQITTYTATTAVIANPERGWFWPYDPGCCATNLPHGPLNVADLIALRGKPEHITLIRDMVQLGMFMNSDISPARLAQIESDWNAARAAGVKIIVRFLYDYSEYNRDPEEAVVNRHIEQLAPLLERNKDVIAFVEGGLFGGSGEGNASDHGYVFNDPASGGCQRLSKSGKRVYHKMLEAVPHQRLMAVRYPRFKWDLLGWSSQTAIPLDDGDAYSGNDQSRIGYYNDGFMGDENSYAFLALPMERSFLIADSAFVLSGGEPSDSTPYKLTAGLLVSQMRDVYHQTTLNAYSTDALDAYAAWKQHGDYDTLSKLMGYRFRLIQSKIPAHAEAGGVLSMSFMVANDGFVRLYNPRGLEVILRNSKTGHQHKIVLDDGERKPAADSYDPRHWVPGATTEVTINARLPADLATGNYEVLLNLPDPSPRLHDRPEYSIRMANEKLWESSTGYNNLLFTLKVN